jgi:hypothetical protein
MAKSYLLYNVIWPARDFPNCFLELRGALFIFFAAPQPPTLPGCSPLSLHHCGASLKDVSNREPVYCRLTSTSTKNRKMTEN